MKNWFRETKRRLKIRYLLRKYALQEFAKRTFRKLRSHTARIGQVARKSSAWVWGRVRSFGAFTWKHTKRASGATYRKVGAHKMFAAIAANKFVIPVLLGMTALSGVIAWQVLRLASKIPSVQPRYWWIGLGVLVAVPLLIWLAKAAKRRGATGSPAPTPTTPAATTRTGDIVINFTGLLWSVVLLGALGTAVIYRVEIRDYLSSWQMSRSSTQTVAMGTKTPSLLPADVALPIIADCESGLRDPNGRGIPGSARQFDENGQAIESGSGDIGRYQINMPTHAERADSLDIDLYTEEGNERYARILYGENGTQDWNASRGCWEPKLIALGHRPDSDSFGIEAGREWTEYVDIIRPWGLRSEPIGVKYEVQVDNHRPIRFPNQSGQYVAQPDGAKVRFRSLEDEPVKLVMRWK